MSFGLQMLHVIFSKEMWCKWLVKVPGQCTMMGLLTGLLHSLTALSLSTYSQIYCLNVSFFIFIPLQLATVLWSVLSNSPTSSMLYYSDTYIHNYQASFRVRLYLCRSILRCSNCVWKGLGTPYVLLAEFPSSAPPRGGKGSGFNLSVPVDSSLLITA